MKPLVIYHAGCWDGFCAAWVMRHALPDADFHAAHYGTAAPDVTGRDVYLVDFAFKRPAMLTIVAQACGNVTVLDHHKTAEADLAGLAGECHRDTLVRLPHVVFDMTKSGGRLAWEYVWDRLYAGVFRDLTNAASGERVDRTRSPWLVDYTEDRDLWRHVLPRSREVNAALRSYPLDFATWDALADRDPLTLVAEGTAILRAEQVVIDQHIRHAREVEIGGHRVLCVNATTLFSEIAGELAAGRPFGACYFDRHDGKRVYSLRSRDGGVDVSEVAKAMGGGGHRNAAGFEVAPPG
jgi:uncharacterized protein